MNVCVIPSLMGRDIFLTCFFYPYLIPNGILANGFVIVHSQKCPDLVGSPRRYRQVCQGTHYSSFRQVRVYNDECSIFKFLILDFGEFSDNKSVRNKTTQACPERIEGRSTRWRFRHPCNGCRKRLFSLVLEKSYSDLHLLTVMLLVI